MPDSIEERIVAAVSEVVKVMPGDPVVPPLTDEDREAIAQVVADAFIVGSGVVTRGLGGLLERIDPFKVSFTNMPRPTPFGLWWLPGEYQRLYMTSAQFKHAIDTFAQHFLPALVAGLAQQAREQQRDFDRHMKEMERVTVSRIDPDKLKEYLGLTDL